MASRSVLSGFPVNPSTPINPMTSGHSSAMRMPAMPQNSLFRVMGSTPNQYHQPYPQRSSMSPSRGMPMGGMGSMGSPLPGPSYSGAMPMRPGMPQAAMDPARKRLLQPQQQQPGGLMGPRRGVKRRKMADKVLPQRIRDLVPESQAYMDLLAFERKLDQTIARKRMEIQEAIKKPITQKRKLRIYISNTYTPAKPEGEEAEKVASWELRVEGKLLEDPGKQKRKFSSFFKSLVIELDKELYGPDNHLVEWHRMPATQETDGFQVKRPGDVNVKCTLLLMLDHQVRPFLSLEPFADSTPNMHYHTSANYILRSISWIHAWHDCWACTLRPEPVSCRPCGFTSKTTSCKTAMRKSTLTATDTSDRGNKGKGGYTRWLYCVMKLNRTAVILQIFGCHRMRFSDIPMKLASLLQHPEPIIINHIISVDPNDQKKTACFDIDVEVDDPLKAQMTSFLSSTTNQQEISALEMKIHETIESINQLKTQRDFMLSFSNNPQDFIQDWLKSQSRDLKLMTDIVGNPEVERRTEFYHSPWVKEAIGRYVFSKVQQRRQELEQVLGIRLT
ncbi:SWI/SNF-related matrix-associated actin-dependent regulator of chromatin subfamily D member 2-like isoform X1 [Carassius gibelio]|uniref:SWI/SNF-related matrix-associated actin-dependent regulator of chromatin subfamily D member 2-like isoform X1 n=1 Tax=Carassius gibelio TaxID=101364 RepID=UPI002279883B|nr:SWI/SNF-related matrix-associated actin-dependent regulator of chromatin subfamily D member 2-like isoform X1 [Carassius gibelio]